MDVEPRLRDYTNAYHYLADALSTGFDPPRGQGLVKWRAPSGRAAGLGLRQHGAGSASFRGAVFPAGEYRGRSELASSASSSSRRARCGCAAHRPRGPFRRARSSCSWGARDATPPGKHEEIAGGHRYTSAARLRDHQPSSPGTSSYAMPRGRLLTHTQHPRTTRTRWCPPCPSPSSGARPTSRAAWPPCSRSRPGEAVRMRRVLHARLDKRGPARRSSGRNDANGVENERHVQARSRSS